VIKTGGSAALVELKPETGVRHQLRVHLSQALGCSILGDHKYSHDDKYAPQRLPDDMLVRLDLTQAQVRKVPMHLHAIEVRLPGLGEEGKDLFITAPLPPFFRYTLKKLKLTSKKE
jgi:mitochondrial RNA pseudouridine synthase RPUSD4